MNLLKIQTTAVEYQLRIERPKLEMQNAMDYAKVQLQTTPTKINMKSENIKVDIDTTDMRRSMNLVHTGEMLKNQAEKGEQQADKTVADMKAFAKQVGQIQDGVKISEVVSQKILAGGRKESFTAFLPSVGPTISWEPGDLQKQVVPADTQTDWQLNKKVLDYIPGKVELIVNQRPEVDIEYIGGFRYVPPSSDPNYEEK